MRLILVVALTLVASGALADDVKDAHKLALEGRDSYWNCLAREYSRPDAKSMSPQDFTATIAGACPSERQNFRVALLDYLSLQFPDNQADTNLTTANHAIELAQKDIVTAFARRKGVAN
jgi:hypothetical protein